MTASRQLSASRSRRIELRSTAALHGSANGRSVIVATHSASAVIAACRRSSRVVELLEGERAHRLEHAVADAALVRPPASPCSCAPARRRDSVAAGSSMPIVGRDVLRRRRARSRWEHRQPLEHPLLVGDRAGGTTSRSSPASCRGGRPPAAAHRSGQAEPVVERADDRRHPERRRAGRGQLDGERDAVEPPADVRRSSPARVDRQVGTGRGRPLPEQLHRGRRRIERSHRRRRARRRRPSVSRLVAIDRQARARRRAARRRRPPRCRRRARSCRARAACRSPASIAATAARAGR